MRLLEREPYYSRSIDELIEQLNGAIFFTIVDMDKGYWQVVLHPESRKYTCMAFDIGRYQFKRLPMGSKIASDIFQKKLDSVYIGLPGVTGIADDMIVYGRTEEEHDRNLILFLGGLSLHLNHLIGSRVTNYDWPFGTLPFGLLWSNLDTMDLLVIFDICHFLTIRGPFEYFSKNGCSQKIKVFSMKDRSLRGVFDLV